MDTNRETEKVILSIQKATMLMDPFFKIGVAGTMFLITYLARLRREGILKKGEFKNFQEFLRITDGNFTIENIPVPDGFRVEQLQELGIRGMVMPDLNPEDGFLQLAVYGEDKEKFQAWFTRYLYSRMQGGEHRQEDLANLAGRNTSIIGIPFENEMEFVREDFDKLGINYAILPDLNVGDGEIQLMIANVDMPKVEYWYQLYQEQQLSRGNEVKDMKSISMDQYIRTAELTEEQYADTASAELKQRMEKYEGREYSEIEQSLMDQERKVQPATDETYQKLHSDPSYVEISINRETLVEQSTYAGTSSLERYGLFASRIPGTWGNQEKTLVLSADQVFRDHDGKTYLAFLKRDEAPCVLGADGKPIPREERKNGFELYRQHYALQERVPYNPEPVQNTKERGAAVQINGKQSFAEHIPANPVKVR